MPRYSEKHKGHRTPGRVTSHDVARLAGVSQAVVSRAFSQGTPIRQETREKVFRAAKTLGYHPNKLARGLISGSSNLVAVVISNIAGSPWRAKLLEALEAELRQKDRQTLLFMAESDENVDALIPQILQYQPNGIIIASGTASSTIAAECMALGTRIVQINRPSPHPGIVEVSCDNYEGGRLAARHLLEAGHRKLTLVGGFRNTYTGIARYQGFVDALNEAGLSLHQEIQCGSSYGSAYQATAGFFGGGDLPSGIFCTSDLRAFAFINAARHQFALKVPEQLSVVGFDDIQDASWPPYELTTIRHPVEGLASAAIEVVEGALERDTALAMLTPKLISRTTVALMERKTATGAD